MAEHHLLEPEQYVHTFGGRPPVLTIADGDSLTAPTRDAAGLDADGQPMPESMRPPEDGFRYLRGNPCVGPIAVDGAEPGDVLAVHLDQIVLTRDTAWSSQGAGMGSLTGEAPGRKLLLNPPVEERMFHWQLDREAMTGSLELPGSSVGRATIPLHPFLGSIGTAPRFGRVETTLAPGEFGGNMDCVETRAGTTLYLPVWVRGGLLAFGDAHAAQGDGELCRSALETSAEVTITVRLIKGWEIQWPRLHDANWIMVAGSSRPLIEALQIAQVELLGWLVDDYGFDRDEAWQLNSQVGRMRIGNVVDPNYTVVAKFPKKYLPA